MSTAFESTGAACFLLARGAKPGLRDLRLEAPLHKAVCCGNITLACALVRAGGSLNVVSVSGLTALDLASREGAAQRDRLLEAITTPPLWVPDDVSSMCMLCRGAFSARRRRHHCRHCGCTVCHSCSPRKLTIDKFGAPLQPVRCCHLCFAVLSGTELAMPPAPPTFEQPAPFGATVRLVTVSRSLTRKRPHRRQRRAPRRPWP